MTLNGTIIIKVMRLTSKESIIKPPVIITEGFSFAVEGGEEENSGTRTGNINNTINGRNHYEKRNQ